MPGGEAAQIPIVELDAPAALTAQSPSPHRSWRPAVAVLAICSVLISAVVVLRGGTPHVSRPVPPPSHMSPRQVSPPPGGFDLPSRDVYPLARGARH
jgi:hypothetical protein